MAIRFGVLGCVFLVAPAAVAQDSPVHGTFEQYLETDPSHKGVLGTLSYLELEGKLGSNLKLVASAAIEPDDHYLDETYLQWSGRSMDAKLGRFRAPFGFNTWSDMYYTPFIELPMIRNYEAMVVPGISLYQLDRGGEVEGWSGPFQYQVSAVDSSDDDWHVYPNQVDTGVIRFQYNLGGAIIGLDGFAKVGDRDGAAEQIGALDFRYSFSRAIIRAEAIRGSGSLSASSYYVDVFYLPPMLSRTQVGVRAQGIETHEAGGYWDGQNWPTASSRGQVYSFAARQFLNQNFTLQLNYGTGSNIPAADGLLGWSVQLQSTFRF